MDAIKYPCSKEDFTKTENDLLSVFVNIKLIQHSMGNYYSQHLIPREFKGISLTNLEKFQKQLIPVMHSRIKMLDETSVDKVLDAVPERTNAIIETTN